ncbi:MAG: phosphoribosylglycinamide formyltransferase [Proteobacteria bacterium]|nr:phosphoribosylglycinamide formyltransferase [Pseudomonadota bacterium]
MARTIRVGALISGGGTNLQAILDAAAAGKIDAEVVFTGSDNPWAKGLVRAEKAGVPVFVADYAETVRQEKARPGGPRLPEGLDLGSLLARQGVMDAAVDPDRAQRFFALRAAWEARLLEEMNRFDWDLLVLAGFMRLLTPYFLDRASPDPEQPRIMNIHPALLPAFPGGDGYGDTFRHGCKVGGCTVHFVDCGEDSGPIIGQKAYAVDPGDDLAAIRKKGLALEWQLFPECIQLFAENRLKITRRPCPAPGEPDRMRKVVEVLEKPMGG